MSASQVEVVLRHVRKLTASRAADALSDRELLQRFAASRDEAAFVALLTRHGPMVLRVGRRVLANHEDAEDIFQAAFLLLARKAGATAWQESVANWLYRVAYHLALKTRAATARRTAQERKAPLKASADPLAEISLREAQTVLDEELARLPEKFRAPLILCCLEGATRDEAARQLGWSLASLKRRLEQGRERLRGRLGRRGLSLGAVLTATELEHATAVAGVPPRLAMATLRATSADGPGVSAKVAALVEGAASVFAGGKAKVLALILALVACLAGVRAVSFRASPAGSGESGAPVLSGSGSNPAEAVPQKHQGTDLHGDALPPGALTRLGTTRLRHGTPVAFLAFTPDGKLLMSGGPDTSDNCIRFSDPLTGKEVRRFRPLQDDSPYCIALSKDGKLVAAGGAMWNKEFKRCGAVLIWDIASGKLLQRIPADTGNPFTAIAFAPDGKTLALGGKDPSIHLFDVATGKVIRRLPSRGGTLAFSPDGKRLASGAGEWLPDTGDHSVRLWEVDIARELYRLQGHSKAVIALAFAPDGKTLASGSEGKTVRFWDVSTGKQQGRLASSLDAVLALKFSPDGKTLVVGCRYGNHPLGLWDTATRKKLHNFDGHVRPVRTIAFSPDGKTLATGGWFDHTVCLWDPATGKERRLGSGHQGPVSTLALLRDGRRVTVSDEDQTVRLWDAEGKELRRLPGPPGVTLCAAISPDGRLVAFGHADWSKGKPVPSIRLHDVASGKEVGRCTGHTGHVRMVAFAPDGKTLASGGDDKTIRIWDTKTAKEVKQFKHDDSFLTVLFSADGKRLVYGGYNAELRIWELATGKVLFKQDSPRSPLDSLALSPDGKLLAEGNCGRVQIWDLASGKHLLELPGRHSDEGLSIHNRCSLAFSPDGRTLVAGGWDDRVRVWEVATWKERRRFIGHPGRISCIAFSCDGRILASGSEDTTALLWDVTGRVEAAAKPVPLSAKELELEWADLADSNAARGYRAMSALLIRPGQAAALLKAKLTPIPEVVGERVSQLLADLGSDRFAVRSKATAELAKLGEAAEGALLKARQAKPILEVRQRIDRLLEKLEGSERLRSRRALEVLELLGTPESRSLLESLGKGMPQAWQTQEARAALVRLRN
jgi:RNA polymerase sigma factor (sigma-70 family)